MNSIDASRRDWEAKAAQIADQSGAMVVELAKYSAKSDSLSAILSAQVDDIERLGRYTSDELQSFQQRINRIEEELSRLHSTGGELSRLDRYARQTRRDLILQEQRITTVLNDARRSDRNDLSTNDQLDEASGSMDAMAGLYLGLEDAFRGSPGEIESRLAEYLPLLEQFGISQQSDLLLDLGCGRGEWLRSLAAAGYRARGCDTNSAMIQVCQEHGLDVTAQSFSAFLQAQPDGSAAVVTAFHLVEHLSLPALFDLLNGTLRVLRQDGILILETPNPQNALVGFHNFYIDPTHNKPLPAVLLQFLVEARGFCDVTIRFMHPYPESMLIADDSPIGQRFNEYFYGPQDYAVIARRP
jgi:O-antigen chain-terminating methyltransferase